MQAICMMHGSILNPLKLSNMPSIFGGCFERLLWICRNPSNPLMECEEISLPPRAKRKHKCSCQYMKWNKRICQSELWGRPPGTGVSCGHWFSICKEENLTRYTSSKLIWENPIHLFSICKRHRFDAFSLFKNKYCI